MPSASQITPRHVAIRPTIVAGALPCHQLAAMNELRVSRSGLSPFAEMCETFFARILPVAPVVVPLDDAFGAVIAEPSRSAHALPDMDRAALDGWAMASGDLVSASSYAPAMLSFQPVFVAIGDPMPTGCDCVVEDKFVSVDGPLAEVRVSAAPGEGVLRAGDDVAEGAALFKGGGIVDATALSLAKAAGLTQLAVRRPAVRLIDVSDRAEPGPTTALIAAMIEKVGGRVSIERAPREVYELSKALESAHADLVVTIGATGDGKDDIAAKAVGRAGHLHANRLAISPGRTTMLGTVGAAPVLALPGRTTEAFASALTLLLPALRRLSGVPEPKPMPLTLSRKIASRIGFAELVLLERDGASCTPIAVGTLPLSALTLLDAWALVPAASEGQAAGTMIAANLFEAGS